VGRPQSQSYDWKEGKISCHCHKSEKCVLSCPDQNIYTKSKKNVYILLVSEVSSGRK
jgi:Pyruvate/2-oxoacid:ferredoxin oxidoreductase delta subunit